MGFREKSRPVNESSLLVDAINDLDLIKKDVYKLAPPTWAPNEIVIEKQKYLEKFNELVENVEFIKTTLEIIRRNNEIY